MELQGAGLSTRKGDMSQTTAFASSLWHKHIKVAPCQRTMMQVKILIKQCGNLISCLNEKSRVFLANAVHQDIGKITDIRYEKTTTKCPGKHQMPAVLAQLKVKWSEQSRTGSGANNMSRNVSDESDLINSLSLPFTNA